MIALYIEFTAAVVVINFELFIQPLVNNFKGGWDLFVSGGGARNKTLMKLVELFHYLLLVMRWHEVCYFRSIEQRFKKHDVTVSTTNMLGIDPDAKEVPKSRI